MRGSTAGRVPPAGEGGGCTQAEGLRPGPVGLSEGHDDKEPQARREQQELALSQREGGPRAEVSSGLAPSGAPRESVPCSWRFSAPVGRYFIQSLSTAHLYSFSKSMFKKLICLRCILSMHSYAL